jgi:hypothetical protein
MELPTWLRFIITTHPENRILSELKRYEYQTSIDLDADTRYNADDMMLFLKDRLSRIVDDRQMSEAIERMLSKCGGNFLLADKLLNNITPPPLVCHRSIL